MKLRAGFQRVALLWKLTTISKVKEGREFTENQSEENSLPARKVTENYFGGVRLAFWSSANYWHSLPRKFDFPLREQPVRFRGARGVGQAEVSEDGDWEGNNTVDDCKTLEREEWTVLKNLTKEPSPACQTSVAIERVINSSLQESTEDWCDWHCGLQNSVALSEFTFIVPAAKDVVKSWPVSRFEEADDESESEHLVICLCTCEAKRENCPTDFKEGDPDWKRAVR
jgi:hypothetical protein